MAQSSGIRKAAEPAPYNSLRLQKNGVPFVEVL